ncbi:MAG: 30S ribosomal protein S7 [archaeon]|nr:30S ribosomal protein S7 [archaeon]
MAKKKSEKIEKPAADDAVETEKKEEKSPKVEEKSPDEEKISTEEKKTPPKKSKKEIKLFNRWSFNSLNIKDPSLENYINLVPIIIPHSGGKHEHKRFWKTERVSIVERFINKMLAPGLIGRRIKGRNAGINAGKKQKVLKIMENAFSIIEETTGDNPIQIIVNAVINCAPREETTRISLGGISYQTAVDISPQRRVDLGIKLLVQASIGSAYNNLRTIDECIANELMLAARKDQNSKAVRRKDEIERIAISAR